MSFSQKIHFSTVKNPQKIAFYTIFIKTKNTHKVLIINSWNLEKLRCLKFEFDNEILELKFKIIEPVNERIWFYNARI